MLHKCLQGHIVCEDGLRALRPDTAIRSGARGVRRRWVELGQQEARLRAAMVTDNEAGKREAVGDEILVTLC
jgi:hypothetical protein